MAVIALTVAVTMVFLTTFLHRATDMLSASLESVHVLEGAEIDLLIYSRAADAIVAADQEEDLLRKLRNARRFVATAEEQRTLYAAEAALGRYFDAHRSGADKAQLTEAFQTAYSALAKLVSINVIQGRVARAQAAEWDRVANVVGIVTGVAVVTFVGIFLWWLNARAMRPVFALAEAMHRFAQGDTDARALEIGPGELREMAAQFNGMATALVRQRKSQLSFLAGVAHDLRNPLSALRLSVAAFRPDDVLPEGHRLWKAIGVVRRQIDRLDRMVGDFLDTARIEAGELDLHLAESDVRDIAAGVVELFRDTAMAHDLQLHVPDSPVHSYCDGSRIEQVLNNLVSNAIKYSPRGGPIEVSVSSADGEARISVADRGVGISSDELVHLFEPFRRVSRMDSMIPGVGLGLFVARRIVEAHGGRIHVRSRLGDGATFTVALPLSEGEPLPPSSPEAPAQLPH